MFDSAWQDLRYAWRSLAQRPLVTSVALLSLALGIGINTAIFSVFERLMLRPLPVTAPEALVNVTSPGPRPGATSTGDGGDVEHIFSYPLFRDLERLESTGFSHLAALRDFPVNLAYRGNTTRGDGLLVSGQYFSGIGVQPALGRVLTPDDDREPGASVVVLTHAYWMTRFGGDPGVVGEPLIVNGEALTIVGVSAEGFRGTVTSDTPQVFVPLALTERLHARTTPARNDHWLYVTARLKPGVTVAQATAQINPAFSAIIRDVEFPAQRRGLGDRGRAEFLKRQIVLEDGARGRNTDRDEEHFLLTLILGITGLVLLIACANLANLMLARAADRTAEIALRLSIGAGRWRVARLLTTEALLLGVLGGALALVVARGALTGLLTMMPADDAARMPFEINGTILLFTLALGLGTGVLFGLFPAVHILRTIAGGNAMQPGRSSESRATRRFRTSLATAQIALATALLAQAGLFLTSLVNVGRVNLGIERENVMTFRLSPHLNGHTPERAMALFAQVADELRGVPGVTAVTLTNVPILANSSSSQNVTVEGFEPAPDTDTNTVSARIGADYFRTLGIPVRAGRDLAATDMTGSRRVAIVNEAFARKFQLGDRVIGTRLGTGAGDIPIDIEIVGLVRDTPYSDVKAPPPPQLYMPYTQGRLGTFTFYVRATGEAAPLRTAIQGIVARADPNLPIEHMRTIDEQIWDNVTPDRVVATLSAWFAVLATLLAAIGLYAVLAYTVAQRVREFGIRMALGATPALVRRQVLAHVGRMCTVGGVAGIAAAVALGTLAQTLLFGVEGTNVAVLAGATAGVMLVALGAAAVPAHRASRSNPAIVLRGE